MAPYGKELSEDVRNRNVALRKDGLGYKKIANTLKLTYIMVSLSLRRPYASHCINSVSMAMCGGALVRRTSCLQYGGGIIMVLGCMSAAGTGELQFIEGNMNSNKYCYILKQSMILSLRNNPKHTSKMTTALLRKLKVKVMDWLSMSLDLNPIEHSQAEDEDEEFQ